MLAAFLFSSAQDTVWVRHYNGPDNDYDLSGSICLDNAGDVFVSGYSNSTASGEDFITIKYSSAGVEQWVELYNGTGNGSDAAYAMAVDVDANVYVTGTSPGTTTTYDFVTIKYNTSGSDQWTAVYNGPTSSGDVANAIAVDDAGHPPGGN